MEPWIIVFFDLLYILLYSGIGTHLKCNGAFLFCSTQPLCDNSFFILCKQKKKCSRCLLIDSRCCNHRPGALNEWSATTSEQHTEPRCYRPEQFKHKKLTERKGTSKYGSNQQLPHDTNQQHDTSTWIPHPGYSNTSCYTQKQISNSFPHSLVCEQLSLFCTELVYMFVFL